MTTDNGSRTTVNDRTLTAPAVAGLLAVGSLVEPLGVRALLLRRHRMDVVERGEQIGVPLVQAEHFAPSHRWPLLEHDRAGVAAQLGAQLGAVGGGEELSGLELLGRHLDAELGVPVLGLAVVLVLDLPDDLFDDVLERHQPVDVAEFIHHESHVDGLLLHLKEDFFEGSEFRHEERLAQDVLDRKIFIINKIGLAN